jgi:hypothetical protein
VKHLRPHVPFVVGAHGALSAAALGNGAFDLKASALIAGAIAVHSKRTVRALREFAGR